MYKIRTQEALRLTKVIRYTTLKNLENSSDKVKIKKLENEVNNKILEKKKRSVQNST